MFIYYQVPGTGYPEKPEIFDFIVFRGSTIPYNGIGTRYRVPDSGKMFQCFRACSGLYGQLTANYSIIRPINGQLYILILFLLFLIKPKLLFLSFPEQRLPGIHPARKICILCFDFQAFFNTEKLFVFKEQILKKSFVTKEQLSNCML
jgi:hypothetical protein